MTCTTHPWAIPANGQCPSCWISGLVAEEQAKEGARNRKSASARVRRQRKRIHGSLLAQATFDQGLSSGQRALREQGARNRTRAIELLNDGMDPLDVDEALGMSRGWCTVQGMKHPALGRAVRKQRAG